MFKKIFILIFVFFIIAIPVSAFIQDDDLKGHWAEKEIIYLIEHNIVKDISKNKMAIDLPLRAYEWENMINRLSNNNVTTLFSTSTITREEAILKLYKVIKRTPTLSTLTLTYKDAVDINAKNVEAIKWATLNGFIKGDDKHYFKPKKLLTCAEGMVIMYRYLNSNLDLNQNTSNKKDTVHITISDYSEDKILITLSWGPLSTGGYTLKIVSYKIIDNTILIKIKKTLPNSDDIVTQAISYASDQCIIAKKELKENYQIKIIE